MKEAFSCQMIQEKLNMDLQHPLLQSQAAILGLDLLVLV
jgi:hypothetical protein